MRPRRNLTRKMRNWPSSSANILVHCQEEQTNLSLLMGMNSQLEANTQALSRAQQDKIFNESLLNQQQANLEASQAMPGRNPETAEPQLNALQDQLTTLQTRYTPEHPDIIKLKNKI